MVACFYDRGTPAQRKLEWGVLLAISRELINRRNGFSQVRNRSSRNLFGIKADFSGAILAAEHLFGNRRIIRVAADEVNVSIVKAEPSEHFTPANSSDRQSATVEILDHPFSFQGDVQQRRADRATHLRPSLTPIETGILETAS
jgi:hypothetical protein